MHGIINRDLKLKRFKRCRAQLLSEANRISHFTLIYVEFYLYPTVSTVLIHSVKPKLTE